MPENDPRAVLLNREIRGTKAKGDVNTSEWVSGKLKRMRNDGNDNLLMVTPSNGESICKKRKATCFPYILINVGSGEMRLVCKACNRVDKSVSYIGQMKMHSKCELVKLLK